MSSACDAACGGYEGDCKGTGQDDWVVPRVEESGRGDCDAGGDGTSTQDLMW